MGRPPLHEQIEALDGVRAKYPDLRRHLDFYQTLLEARKPIEESPTKGTALDFSAPSVIHDLQRRALSSGWPISHFLDDTVFDGRRLLPVVRLESLGDTHLRRITERMGKGELDVQKLIGAILREDDRYIREQGEMSGSRPDLLILILSTMVQPCLEEIARRVASSFLDDWGNTMCPVCGRKPIIGRLKRRRLHLTCMLCGAEYLSDLFLCVSCGNADPYTLKSLIPTDQPGFRINSCDNCNHYLKVIDEDRTFIVRGLEDIVTARLDGMARKAGLRRPGWNGDTELRARAVVS